MARRARDSSYIFRFINRRVYSSVDEATVGGVPQPASSVPTGSLVCNARRALHSSVAVAQEVAAAVEPREPGGRSLGGRTGKDKPGFRGGASWSGSGLAGPWPGLVRVRAVWRAGSAPPCDTFAISHVVCVLVALGWLCCWFLPCTGAQHRMRRKCERSELNPWAKIGMSLTDNQMIMSTLPCAKPFVTMVCGRVVPVCLIHSTSHRLMSYLGPKFHGVWVSGAGALNSFHIPHTMSSKAVN